MAKTITGKKLASNVIISVAAQLISLAIGFFLNLIVPKFIDELQYAHWQTYLLYVSYVGILHFGLLDGFMLRYAQYDYEELDKERVRSIFKALLIFTGTLTLVTSCISLVFVQGISKQVVILVAIGITSKNLYTYNSYSFQSTNRIQKYALLVISQRLVYGLGIAACLLLGVQNFVWFCIADLAGDMLSSLLVFRSNKGMYLGKALPLKEGWAEVLKNVSSGIMLMLANWSAMLIVNSAKMIVQWRWDSLVFGKVSFAFSLANIVLSFITAVSIVLFPSLKRLDENKLPSLYKTLRGVLSPLLLGALLLYFPGCWILEMWLPKYLPSLTYLGILLPIIVFTSKVTLLTNTYLKTYRKEKQMLLINVFSACIGVVACLLCAYVFHDLTALLISIVAVVMLNSILSECIVLRVIKVRIWKEFVLEGVLVAAFILAVQYLPLWTACLVYLGAFLMYCLVNMQSIKTLITSLLQRRKK